MTDYKFFDLFSQNSINKQVLIEYDGGVITNSELFAESMEITESLCSEHELRFGSCEASAIKFKVGNVVIPLFSKWITVKMYLNGSTDTLFQIGRYKVYSDKPTADRKWREIVAYDAMYEIINTDVADWYNKVLPNADSTMTMKAFRTSFLSYFGITQESINLVNDSMTIQKTIQPDEISGKDVIRAICEINGCFGHITRTGTFKYIYLERNIQGLYPKNDLYPANNLYPLNPKSTAIGAGGTYISATYEDFKTKSIDKLQIRKEENDIGVIIGGDTAENAYIIEDNFLVYGKTTEELTVIANNIFNQITQIIYRPFDSTLKGNPCLEVGDAVRLVTKHELIESYILQRTLKGIQALKDSFSAEGVENYSEKVNSLHKSILQLKGKTNVLARTIEETKSTISDVEKGLKTQITQNANSITAEVERAIAQEVELAAAIKITSDSITAEVKRAENAESVLKNAYESKIKQTAEEISTQISEMTQAFDKTGYDITYEEPKDPDIDVQVGKYWLNTVNGNLYVGALIPTVWENLGQFHSATLTSGSSAGEQRWYLVGEGKSIYSKYGDRAGFNMTKYGGFNIEPPADDSYPINSWWMNIIPQSVSTITLEQYLADLNTSYPNDYMTLYEKTANSRKEWQFVKTLDIITLSDMQSSFSQMANAIVLKVRNNGELAEVKLVADAEDGTLFRVKANNIDLTATEVINLMSGGELNLTGKKITIKSNNFEVNSNGDVKCRNITAFSISGDAVGQFNTNVDDSLALQTARQAISTAQKAANSAQKAADDAQDAIAATNVIVNNLNDTIIPQLNTWINQLSAQIKELGKPGIS